MESDIQKVADLALEQSGVTGYICVDNEGLCLAAKGQVNHSMSGIIHQLAGLASKIETQNQSENSTQSEISPVIRVDLERYRIIIQSRESITTAVTSLQK